MARADRTGLSQLLLTAQRVPVSTPSAAWPWSKFIGSKISEPEEFRLTKIVVLPSMNSTKTCRTCSCVFVVLKFVLHVPSAFCTKTHKDRDCYTTHISFPSSVNPLEPSTAQLLLTRWKWAVAQEESRWTKQEVEEKRYKSWLDNFKRHFLSCWVQLEKTQLMILPACRRVFSHSSTSSAKFNGANHSDLFGCSLI